MLYEPHSGLEKRTTEGNPLWGHDSLNEYFQEPRCIDIMVIFHKSETATDTHQYIVSVKEELVSTDILNYCHKRCFFFNMALA